MNGLDDIVERLAAAVGVAETYTDAFGNPHATSAEGKRAILAAFGLPTDSEAEAGDSLERLLAFRQGLAPPLVVAELGAPVRVPVRGAGEVAWRLTAESGAARDGRAAVERGSIELPTLPAGYHRLAVQADGRQAEATIIVAPPRCFESPALADGARLWGVTAQVYGLATEHDLGIGDYTAIGEVAEGAGALDASFLGLSPLHALFAADRSKISPYSPSSRLFLETIHLDPSAIDGFEASVAQSGLAEDVIQQRIGALRSVSLVDHAAVWATKRPLFDALWADFRAKGPDRAFAEFRREGGEALEAHATFEALSEHFWAQGAYWPGAWPSAFRQPRGPEVMRFREDHSERVAFHAWLQWQADRQLARAAERARAAGMGIGLYRDLAVGCDPGGSEIWAAPDRFAGALSVGAPPDAIAPRGQDWGLPPFDPLALQRQGLIAFRDLVRANMRHAGAIRIDHAFQLRRLFLIPVGAPAADGAYVDFPFEALLAVLRVESHRARCLVIAEDLGNAPAGFSDAIMAAGVLSYRVLSFERTGDGGYRRPDAYPRDALAVVTTHDLPTFRGWWRGLDIDLRQSIGLYDRAMADQERRIRTFDKEKLAEALAGEGLLPAPDPLPEEPPFEAAARYLARTAAALTGMQLEDAAGELVQANLPGVNDEAHPNWRRRSPVTVEELTMPGGELAKLAAALASEGRGRRPRPAALASPPPRATYRLQFHAGFTFDDAAAIVPYLAKLGVSHVYSSPIHTARPGSMHGYDIVDHAAINPELGGEPGFVRLSDRLKEHGLGLILDIVPNHMGVGGSDNAWWLSVLEWGELSPAAAFFDIDWQRLGAHGKLIVPFLGDRYGEALEKGELRLAFDAEEGSFSVWHWEHRFPICPLHYPIILERSLAALGEAERSRGEVLGITERLRVMAEEADPQRRVLQPDEAETLRRNLAEAVGGDGPLKEAIDRAVALINGAPGIADSFGTLHRILEAQAYRLAHWRVAASDINYRRFFDINGLAGLRMEVPELFERAHEMVFRLVRDGRIQGLRIDHVDGMADPEAYTRALQSAVGPGFYVVIEKILEPGERLRPWPIAGTTGYDAMTLIDGVFVDQSAEDAFEHLYRRATGLEGSYGRLLRAAKEETLETSFASELEVLVSDLKRIADADRRTRDYTVNAIRKALAEIITRFPVYRTYITDAGAEEADRRLLEETVRRAKRASVLPDRSVHDFVLVELLGAVEAQSPPRPQPELGARFRTRFQQLTGPVMAKSLEDTLFYRFVRLVALNEVGGDPHRFGVSPEEFHAEMEARAAAWPHAMLASATHDTKRGEDARGRLIALSEVPAEWSRALATMEEILVRGSGQTAPDANDRYLLLQTVLGAWPMELLDGTDAETAASFRDRIQAYATKALREAKRHTSWVNIDEDYEAAAGAFIDAALDADGPFLDALRPIARRLAVLGMLNGLARTALKLTLPGVPDLYQGADLWDLSLVDPDNRRAVGYALRASMLQDERPIEELLAGWPDGRVKQRLVARLLAERASRPELYAEADYRRLEAEGERARHLLAFHRSHKGAAVAVVVPRLVASLVDGERMPLGSEIWLRTRVPLPAGTWLDVVTGAHASSAGDGKPVGELFTDLPIAVLRKIS